MFSKQLILKAVDFMPNNSHNELDHEIIKLDLDSKGINLSGSIGNKKNAIQNYLLANPNARDNHGDSILLKMMDQVVNKMLINVNCGLDEFDEETLEFKSDPNFYRYLRLDGYDIDFEKMRIKENISNYTNTSAKNDYIVNFLKKYHFVTSLGHYEQAKSSYLGGNYAALNGQLRSFVEGIFQDMATYIKIKEPHNDNINKISNLDAQQAILIFTKCQKPIIDINLNEYEDNGTGFIQAFWKRLHPEGSHPGLPHIEEALYRFQLVVLNIELLLKRFEKSYPLLDY